MKKYKPIKDFLSAEDLAEIEGAIGAAERMTAGEIKVVIVAKSRKGLFRVFDAVKAVEMRAIHEFKKMGVHKTRERTGVLLMISRAEQRIRIIADEGIHSKVDAGTWDSVVEMMLAKIKEGKQKEAMLTAVASIGQTLARHFPAAEGDANEVSNEVVVEG